MARRKNKKSDSRRKDSSDVINRPSEGAEAPAVPSLRQEAKKTPPDKGKDEKKVAAAQPRRGRVTMVTFMAGMFLSLIFGIYIGSLLPGLLQEGGNAEQIPPSISAATDLPAPETASPPPANKAPAETEPAIPKKLAERIGELEKAVAAGQHGNANAWTELGNLYFDTSQPNKAIGAYEHALAIAPSNPDVLTDLGIMYREIHDYGKAVECFRKASAIVPAHANALFNEGVVFAMDLKKKDEAIAAWERLLKLNPGATAPDGKKVAEMVEDLRR